MPERFFFKKKCPTPGNIRADNSAALSDFVMNYTNVSRADFEKKT